MSTRFTRGAATRAERNPGHRPLTVRAVSPQWVAGTSRHNRRRDAALARRAATGKRMNTKTGKGA